jgi:hypothetical protein
MSILSSLERGRSGVLYNIYTIGRHICDKEMDREWLCVLWMEKNNN